MILQRNILILYNINYHQQFIECYKELSEAICILSSETFAVILYMLLLIRLQGFHKLGEGGGPDHGPLPVAKY